MTETRDKRPGIQERQRLHHEASRLTNDDNEGYTLSLMLDYLTRWLSGQSEAIWLRHTFFRGLLLALLVMIPTGLWLRQVLSPPPPAPGLSGRRLCPPSSTTSLYEALKHPERYRYRSLWYTGRVIRTKPQCFPCPANRPRCCAVCHAQTRLLPTHPQLPLISQGVKLDGLVHGKRLTCQGTSCDLPCHIVVPGTYYAILGRLMVLPSTKASRRGRYKATRLWVQHICALQKAPKPDSLSVPDPAYP